MKKYFIIPMVLALILVLSVSSTAFAQDETTLPDPGTTPDSPFYFMEQLGKQFSLMFTFNAEAKVQKALRYADEKLAEMDAMMTQNKIKSATKASEGYQNCLKIAAKYMEQARLKGANVTEEVALMAEKHLGFLGNGAGNIPEDARMIRTQTQERAMTCQETALRTMAQGDPEQAVQLNLQLMERKLNWIRVRAEGLELEGLQERLEECNRLGRLGEEISQIARQLGVGDQTTVDQLIGQATAYHLQVLAQIHQRVQEQAQYEVQEAIQNCVQNHEQVVNRLQEQNQLGQVPEEPLIPEEIIEQVGQYGSSKGSGPKP